MKVPFLDLKSQYKGIKKEVLPAIENILENSAFILGKDVFEFEKQFAAKHNAKYCIALSSGTDANHCALWAAGIGPGDEVIMPVNTFVATAWGATLCGAVPVFVECEKDSYNLDPEKIESAITSKTKAIVAVHLYGQPAKMEQIKEIADEYNLILLEDCAQSHNAEYNGVKVGTYGLASSFSFYPGKNLGAYGEGGAVLTNSEAIAEKVKMMRDHGCKEKYQHEIYGHNYRMEGIQGAVLGIKLKYLDKWTNERKRAASLYNLLLSDVKELNLPHEMPNVSHVYHLFVIHVKNGGKDTRDQLAKYLNDCEISTGLHYPIPLHLQKCFKHLNYKSGDFPVAEELAETGLSLPIYPEILDEQIEFVVEKIKEFFRLAKQTDKHEELESKEKVV